MFNPFKSFENLIYRVREFLWEIPPFLFDENQYKVRFKKLYSSAIPYSHFIFSAIISILLFVSLFIVGIPKVISGSNSKLIEAVVLGIDENGQTQQINKINPLIISNIQLEKDLVNLIYEPLIRYETIEQKDGKLLGAVRNILAQDIIKIKQGADYEFILKDNVTWHDGNKFTADDVIRTFNLLSQVNAQNSYTQALSQMQWEKVSDFSVRICTKPLDQEPEGCEKSINKPILSNFLELISFNIIPEHLSSDITPDNINSPSPILYKAPIGTGQYKFKDATDLSISVEQYKNYHNLLGVSKVKEIQFKIFKTSEDALNALKTGEVHSFASLSSEYKSDLSKFPQISLIESEVLQNQFWALYFNLRSGPDGNAIGPSFLQDKNVRKAISAAVNREEIINNALDGLGEEAFGPIYKDSYFYNSNAAWVRYNSVDSASLLDKSGWTFKQNNKYRTNDKGEEMQFSLYFVNSYDREKVAKQIQSDLEKVGIKVLITKDDQLGFNSTGEKYWNLEDLNNQILSPRLFDVILYGMNTFIDPDRYELYHSSQVNDPGLNISGYIGTEPTVVRNENAKPGEPSVKRVPKVDRWLELGRSYDPESSRDERRERYFEVQQLIAEDSPIVYLYNPQFIYYVNNKIEKVVMNNVLSLEDRFNSIADWEI